MRSEFMVAIVAMVGIVGLLYAGVVSPSGAFVGRPMVQIFAEGEPAGPIACSTVESCTAPSCPTGLTRVAIRDRGIWSYQWVTIPEQVDGQALGNCCEPGTQVSFRVRADGIPRSMSFGCYRGMWNAVLS